MRVIRWLPDTSPFSCFRSKRVDRCLCLKKNQNAPRPSEHPPVRGLINAFYFSEKSDRFLDLTKTKTLVF